MALALASPAFGQSSVEGYNDSAGQVQAEVNSSGGGGGSLPFTGLDVALLAAAGGVLAAVGLGMRRLTRGPESA